LEEEYVLTHYNRRHNINYAETAIYGGYYNIVRIHLNHINEAINILNQDVDNFITSQEYDKRECAVMEGYKIGYSKGYIQGTEDEYQVGYTKAIEDIKEQIRLL